MGRGDSSVFSGALTRAAGETVAGGPYAISQGTVSGGSNYSISYTGDSGTKRRVMTTANNHTMDGGSEGMFMTNRLLDEARITHAGSGKDLTEARKARVGITPKGTIGVVGKAHHWLIVKAESSSRDRSAKFVLRLQSLDRSNTHVLIE